MISYSPPKAQLWGHWCKKLTAVQLSQRAEVFLREQADVVQAPSQQFILAWAGSGTDHVSVALDALAGRIGVAAEAPEVGGPQVASRRIQCELPVETIGVAAKWLDDLYLNSGDQPFFAMLTTYWIFRWRNLAASTEISEQTESTFGLHLARPRAVTTRFTFSDVEHYQQIKKYLANLELVLLSDKHVRPKNALAAGERGRS